VINLGPAVAGPSIHLCISCFRFRFICAYSPPLAAHICPKTTTYVYGFILHNVLDFFPIVMHFILVLPKMSRQKMGGGSTYGFRAWHASAEVTDFGIVKRSETRNPGFRRWTRNHDISSHSRSQLYHVHAFRVNKHIILISAQSAF
jgi:hypothetical protein